MRTLSELLARQHFQTRTTQHDLQYHHSLNVFLLSRRPAELRNGPLDVRSELELFKSTTTIFFVRRVYKVATLVSTSRDALTNRQRYRTSFIYKLEHTRRENFSVSSYEEED